MFSTLYYTLFLFSAKVFHSVTPFPRWSFCMLQSNVERLQINSERFCFISLPNDHVLLLIIIQYPIDDGHSGSWLNLMDSKTPNSSSATSFLTTYPRGVAIIASYTRLSYIITPSLTTLVFAATHRSSIRVPGRITGSNFVSTPVTTVPSKIIRALSPLS